MRHVRFIPVALFTALLSFASARGSSIAGSWPEATAICAVVAAATGVLLASATAWDAGSQDATFLRSASTSRARTAALLVGPALAWGLASILFGFMILAGFVYTAPVGGSPWFLVILSSLVWVGFCAVLGASLGVLIRRRLLAALLAALLALALCVVSARADSTPAFLRFLFFPGNGYELIARQPRMTLIGISIVMVTVLGSCVLAALTRHHPAPRYTALSFLVIITVAAVGSAAVGPQGTRARDTAEASASCTQNANEQRYCSWPEDTALVVAADAHWQEFTQVLVDAGLPPLTGTYGQPGSSHATELSHTITSPAALYTRVYEAQAAALRAQRPCEETAASRNAHQVLSDWATYAFRTQDDRFSTLSPQGSTTPARAWIENELSHRSPAEQARALAPFVHTMQTCDSELPPLEVEQ